LLRSQDHVLDGDGVEGRRERVKGLLRTKQKREYNKWANPWVYGGVG